MTALQISCAFPPGPDVVAHAQLAEELGYERVWLYDSPALYPDVWVTLAQVAEHTERVEIGPAVLVPGLRHPLTQASAIATLDAIAPGPRRGGDRHRVHRPDGPRSARDAVGRDPYVHRAGEGPPRR